MEREPDPEAAVTDRSFDEEEELAEFASLLSSATWSLLIGFFLMMSLSFAAFNRFGSSFADST